MLVRPTPLWNMPCCCHSKVYVRPAIPNIPRRKCMCVLCLRNARHTPTRLNPLRLVHSSFFSRPLVLSILFFLLCFLSIAQPYCPPWPLLLTTSLFLCFLGAKVGVGIRAFVAEQATPGREKLARLAALAGARRRQGGAHSRLDGRDGPRRFCLRRLFRCRRPSRLSPPGAKRATVQGSEACAKDNEGVSYSTTDQLCS